MLPEPVYNERLLLEQLSAGSESAFRELYNKHADIIYSVALQHLKQAQPAEDIVQTLFLNVWENRASVKNIHQFSAWLYIAARNIIISTLRKQGTQEKYLNYLRERMYTATETPELIFDEKNLRSLIKEAVSELPPQQRMAFQLQREEGMSYEDIASQMGIATNTVRAHLYKANQLIRNYLQTHGVDNMAMMLLLILTSTSEI